MSIEIQHEMCMMKKEVHFKKGEIILTQGDTIVDFAYLKSGLIKIHQKKSSPRDVINYIAQPFDFITLLSIFSESTYQYSITAIEDAKVCFFKIEKMRSMLISNSNFGFAVIQRMSSASDKIISLSTELNSRNLRGKIAFVLLLFSIEIYKTNLFRIPITRKEVGELVGVTTENVIRILSEFSKDGIIGLNGKEVEIIKLDKLIKISEKG